MSFKLKVVEEVESGMLGDNEAQRKYGIQGNGTVSMWLRKYGTFDLHCNITVINILPTIFKLSSNFTIFT